MSEPDDDLDESPQPPASRSGYTTTTLPDWAHAELKHLVRELTGLGVDALPADLGKEAAQLQAKDRRAFTRGVVIGIACRHLRASLAEWSKPKATARK